VISSLAAWAGNETPRKWQDGALKLLSQLDLCSESGANATNVIPRQYTKEAWASQLSLQ
jgi:hypothetical protein